MASSLLLSNSAATRASTHMRTTAATLVRTVAGSPFQLVFIPSSGAMLQTRMITAAIPVLAPLSVSSAGIHGICRSLHFLKMHRISVIVFGGNTFQLLKLKVPQSTGCQLSG